MFTSEDCPVKIADISDWRPVSQIPSNGSTERDNDNSSGVYQIAHVSDIKEIGDTLVHQNIGYTGKGKNVYDRTYTVRQPKGSHGVNRYIKQNNLCKESEVFVRYIFCDVSDIKKLEDWIHNNTTKAYGYTFKWREASEGNDGKYSRAQDALEELTSIELLDIISFARELAVSKNAVEFQNKLKSVI
jgi:hypothetical protein